MTSEQWGSAEPRRDFWAAIRIPVRRDVEAVADGICRDLGLEADFVRGGAKVKKGKAQYAARDAVLTALHREGFALTAIASWFGHKDRSTVRHWLKNLGLIDA